VGCRVLALDTELGGDLHGVRAIGVAQPTGRDGLAHRFEGDAVAFDARVVK